jgi:hypothetical protein
MAILFLALAVLIGYLLVRLANAADQLGPRWAVLLFELALGAGGGIAVVSLLFFLLLLLHAASPLVMLPTEAVLLLTSAGLVLIRRRRTAGEPCRQGAGVWWYWILGAALVVSVLAVGAASAKSAQTSPYGYWDAFVMWNLRAKYLAGLGDSWTRAFSPVGIPHPDYPLLISGFVAQLWKFSGGETSTLVPMLTAAVFAASVLTLLVSALAVVRGTGSALIAGLILMTSSSFLMQTMSQYADVPLSFYYLATLVLVFLSVTSEGSRKLVLAALAGAFGSFAVWTKNEGLVFFALCVGCCGFVFRRYRSVGSRTAPVWSLLLGAVPGLLVVGYFKVFLAPRNDLMDQTGAQMMHKFLEFDRYLRIGKSLIYFALKLGDWRTHPLLLLAILAIVLRFRINERQTQGVLATGLTLVLVFAAYCEVYLIMSVYLRFQLDTSLERLYAQVWPSFLFVAFLVLARPEETFVSPRAKPVGGRLATQRVDPETGEARKQRA